MSPVVNGPEWDWLVRRRAELGHKQKRTGLTPTEQAEYEGLQARFRRAIDRAFPSGGRAARDRDLIAALIARYPTFTQGTT